MFKKIFIKKKDISNLFSQDSDILKFKKLNFYDKTLKNFFYKKNSYVSSSLIGERVYLYLGKEFISLKVKTGMVGYKLGEFFFIRKHKLNK